MPDGTPNRSNPMSFNPDPRDSGATRVTHHKPTPGRIRHGVASLLLLATTLLGAGCAHAGDVRADACRLAEMPKEQWALQVPFEVVDGRIYVQARVNGRGPFRFAVDTGASGIGRADASLVAALGLKAQGQAQASDGVKTADVVTTHLDALELDGLSRQDMEVITRDYSSHLAADAAISGILARGFFADGLLVIDYPRRTLSFGRRGSLAPGDGNVLHYARPFRVPVSIGTLQTEGNLDTGANVAMVLPRSLYDTVATGPLQPAGRGRLTNTQIETGKAMLHGPFRIGGVSLADVEVRVSDRVPGLLVGAHALQHFVLMIDQRSNAVALCR